jgi:hypothetical protein
MNGTTSTATAVNKITSIDKSKSNKDKTPILSAIITRIANPPLGPKPSTGLSFRNNSIQSNSNNNDVFVTPVRVATPEVTEVTKLVAVDTTALSSPLVDESKQQVVAEDSERDSIYDQDFHS